MGHFSNLVIFLENLNYKYIHTPYIYLKKVYCKDIYPCLVVTQPFFLDCIASKTNFTHTYTLHFFIPAEAEKGCYDSWKWQSFSCDKNDWNHLVLESIWIANHVEYIFISEIMQNWHQIWEIHWNYFPGLSNFHLSEDWEIT